MQNLTTTLNEMTAELEGDKPSLGDMIAEFESRGFGPLLLVPALISIIPIGAIPGVPAICATFIILIASQMLLGRHHPWIPKVLRERSFKREKVERAVKVAKPWAKRVDKLFAPRLRFLTGPFGTRLVALASIFLALTMIPLEAIPFAVAIPAGSIALLALSLSAKDGLLTLIGLTSTLLTAYAIIAWFPWPSS